MNPNLFTHSTIMKAIVAAGIISSTVLPQSTQPSIGQFSYIRTSYNKSDKFSESETKILEPDNQKALSKSESIRTLDDIQNLQENWNGYGAKPIPKEIVNLCRDIIMELDYQPDIFPTARRTVQMEYELDDNSYLEFEIYLDHISVMEIPKRDYSKAIKKLIPSVDYKTLSSIVLNFHGGFNEWTNPITA